jgi:hypothetical protein
LLVRRLLDLLRLGPSPNQKDVEIAVLRHQLAVLRRHVARPRYSPIDRAVLATLARLLSHDHWGVFLVTPATLMRWHRDLVARSWTYPRRGRSAPNALEDDVVELVLRLARENARWGYLRIVGECRKLGVTVSATTVRKVLRRHRLGPAPRSCGPSWSDFLRAQGGWHPCLRLLSRRHGHAPSRLCTLLHPPRAPHGLLGRGNGSPDRALGSPSKPGTWLPIWKTGDDLSASLSVTGTASSLGPLTR